MFATPHVRLTSGLLGLLSGLGAIASGLLAAQHQAALGVICGASPAPHCGACLLTAAFSLLALFFMAQAFGHDRLSLRPQTAPAAPSR